MPSIDAYRIINVAYGSKNRIDDLNIETDGRHTIIVIPNGCGKTFSITLLLQTVLPGSVLNNRTFEETFSNVRGTAHIMISHMLDNAQNKLVCGITVNNEGSLRYFNWCFEADVQTRLEEIPLVEDAMTLSYEETREWLNKMPYEKRAKVFNQGEKQKLSRHLAFYGIYTDEWEMMYKMNRSEGGVKNIFGSKSRKNTDDLLKEFIIPAITRELKGSEEIDHVQESFLKKIDTLKMIPQWEDEIRRMDDYLLLFGKQVEKLKTFYERESDYRIKLYILKLINESTKEKLAEKTESASNIQLKLKGQQKGTEILELNAQKLIYGNLLYKISMIKEKLSRTNHYLNEAERLRDEKKKELQLIQAIGYVTDYNSVLARYETIERMINKKQLEQTRLKEEMRILEAKLHNYYTIEIQKTNELYESHDELISAVELEKDTTMREIAELSDRRMQKGKERDFLETINEEIQKLGTIERFEEASLSLERVESDIHEKLNHEETIKTEIESLLEHSQGEKIKELELKQRFDNAKADYELYSKKHDMIKQIKKIYHSEQVDELFDQLKSQLEQTQQILLSNRREQSDHEETVEYISRFNTLPPERTVKKLAGELRAAGFHDFILGHDYLKENDDINNKLIAYGIICENLKGLSVALKNTDIPEAPVFVFSRKEVEEIVDCDLKGILKQKNVFIETKRLSILTGHMTLEQYLQARQKELEVVQKSIEKYSERENELKSHLNTVEMFVDAYGIRPDMSEKELKEKQTVAAQDWKECSDALNGHMVTIQKQREELSMLVKEIKDLNEKKKELEIICRKFEDLEHKCAYLVDSLKELPSRIDEYEEDLKKSDEALEVAKRNLNEIKGHLKRLAFKSKEINEKLGVMKQKQRRYKKPDKTLEPEGLYNGEPVESLEEKLNTLKLKFEDEQLLEEEKRLSQQLSQLKSNILKMGYTVEELNRIDRTTLPGYDDCSREIDDILDKISRLNRSLGTHEAQQSQLEEQRDSLMLKAVDIERIKPIDSKTYRILKEKNQNSLKQLQKVVNENLARAEQLKNEIHKIEILYESQKEFLSGFHLPEKIRIKNMDPTIFQQDEITVWNREKNEFLALKDSLESDKKAVETGWTSLQKIINSEQHDMNMNMALIMESDSANILFDYQKIKNLYEQDRHMINTSREMIQLNISKNKQEMETLLENAYRSVECYLNEFVNLSKYSRIETHGKRDVSVKFMFPDMSTTIKKANLKSYIDEILKKISQIEKDRIKEFVSKNFSVKRLIEEVHRKKTILKVYKPSTAAGWYYEDWDNVIKWSQGEQFFAFFLLYASMSIWIRQKRMGLHQSKTVLIADNPFGEAISEHIFNPLLEFMSDNQIQLLTFTAIKERQIIALFPNKYSLILYPHRNTESLIIQPGFFREDF